MVNSADSNERDSNDLSVVSSALRDEASFVSGWLSATPDREQWIRDRLGLNNTSLHRLLTCRSPRPQTFLADVSLIAEYAHVERTALAMALREATVVATLKSSGTRTRAQADAHPVGLLAAARDTAAEQLPADQAATNLRDLADATWHAVPAEVRSQRDVHAALVWASQVVVVMLPRLRLKFVNRWLANHDIAPLTAAEDNLRGLLVAWRGHAVIFVDGSLPQPDSRFTLAHEHGHLLLDYLLPRQRVLRDAPELLDVVDGHRPPSDVDRARAALARLPLGVHTHLLHRDEYEGASQSTAVAEDRASAYALELLAPWEETLALLRARVPHAGTYHDRLGAAADAVADVFGLPHDAATVRAAAGLAELGVRPGFFDR